MAQKRYLTILGTLIYLFMLISFIPILLDFHVSTILSVFSYIAFIFVVIFLFGLFMLYVKENAILLHISVVLPVLLSFTDLIYGITTNLMINSCICQISYLILYFIGVFILKKQKTTPKHKIDFTINTAFWLIGFILFNHLFLVPVALAYLLYEKGVFNKLYATISISVAGIVMMVLFILLSIHFLPFMLIILILLAAYSTADLKETGLRVLSLYGSEDGVLKMDSYEKYRDNLPEDFTEIVIPGGCHAYFGSYGPQKGDGTPQISNEEQIRFTTEAIGDFIEDLN